MRRKVAGGFLHDVNAIKIAGSDIAARVRYHTESEDTLMYVAYYHVSKYLLSCFRAVLLLGRSRYKETANFPEDEDGEEDVAMATEDRTVVPIILRL